MVKGTVLVKNSVAPVSVLVFTMELEDIEKLPRQGEFELNLFDQEGRRVDKICNPDTSTTILHSFIFTTHSYSVAFNFDGNGVVRSKVAGSGPDDPGMFPFSFHVSIFFINLLFMQKGQSELSGCILAMLLVPVQACSALGWFSSWRRNQERSASSFTPATL